MPTFKHHELALLNPSFDSPLVDVLTELEHLRRYRLAGTTPSSLFFQLKSIFHLLESLGSARIEGNHTTLADYVESKVEGADSASDQLREISNIEKAMTFVEDHFNEADDVGLHLLRELHAITVDDLDREGDRTPGSFRAGQVHIAQSSHFPPDPVQVQGYMEELVAFINRRDPQKYDLMKVAIAHHRFGWIHPFSNGNGRVVRLLTYVMLIKYGFNVAAGGRLLNPTAVFCNDRERYYEMLAQADAGTAEGQERWCEYVLRGILDELRKLDRLLDYRYLKQAILSPALAHARERALLTELEYGVLRLLLDSDSAIARSSDLAAAMPGLNGPQRTYQIKKLVERGMLVPIKPNARQYTLGFSHSYLLRGVIRALTAEGFITQQLSSAHQ
ncbi:Fic family protein [Pseudomonas donghuensis]|uniref:Fic family protein n=1 Tax=Pseudomonas donghuensis TaxID=1163398 RepID=A0AAP0SNA0_9PSED|nr:Fic family protein [Pseudomonas donghuensis]MDF9891632.1 Fic family protein [Pseudomonas vranovensis]KDO01927.1 Fic family protein [Pseudomonas donghuensis]MCP6693556.1 Fic family protein [Pseudomonas donghuensis]PJY97083.1 Fic family protein [Pseudomonas donghuensis]UVL25062.1 Fic family protein [Pseudomonas donghuensis]